MCKGDMDLLSMEDEHTLSLLTTRWVKIKTPTTETVTLYTDARRYLQPMVHQI